MGSGKDVIQSIGGRDDIEKIAWVLITIIVSVNHFQKKSLVGVQMVRQFWLPDRKISKTNGTPWKVVQISQLESREDEERERIPHTWAFSDENYLKAIFGSVILRGYFKDDISLVS